MNGTRNGYFSYLLLVILILLPGCNLLPSPNSPDSQLPIKGAPASLANLPTSTTSPCAATPELGVIAFIKQANPVHLYLMDGNGCFQTEIQGNFLSAPTWSPDGKLIAIACDTSKQASICLLSGLSAELLNSNQQADLPAIKDQISVPSACNDRGGVKSISWSAHGDLLALVCGEGFGSVGAIVCIVALNKPGVCQATIGGHGEKLLRAVWSPTENQMALSIYPSIYIADFGNKSSPAFVTDGFSPEWSPDGKQLALIQQQATAPYKMGIIDLNNRTHRLISLPPLPTQPPDRTLPNGREIQRFDVLLYCGDHGMDCRLTWSPDGRYIAFDSLYANPGNWQIFRYELSTGLLQQLTYSSDNQDRFNFAPDWEP